MQKKKKGKFNFLPVPQMMTSYTTKLIKKLKLIKI